MTQRLTATVRLVEESEATDRVAAVFADIKATKGTDSVPDFWRALASSPELLEATWSRLKSVMHPESLGHLSELDPLTREIIALAVSATNGCSYCIQSHTAAARRLGLSTQGLAEVLEVVGLFNMTNALAHGYQVEPDVFPPLD